MPRNVANLSFPDGTQLVALSGSFPVGMLWVEHSGDPRFVHGLFPPKLRTADRDPLGDPFCFQGVKDMNEAWLAEAGLSSAPRGMFFLFVYHAKCVFLIVPYRVEMFNLGKMKFGGGASSGLVVPSVTCASASVVVVDSTIEKCPSVDKGSSLRKCSKRVTPEQLADTSRSTTRVPPEKGKELVELEETPERGYTIQELCEVEDWVGADKYLRRTLHPALAKQVCECSSEELMNKADKSAVWATTLLEVELKAEGPKAVAAYKASLGFESGLEKMGRVSYEFEYRVSLEWLRQKHTKIAIEQDLFAECPDNANVEMDLN
ncbi:hypothetical protein B296_00015703 [Ensete ventricosum]|uniref:Uncharacterized protein n=1 Tax=Ensete ventricosum TaxID=4639 RepID=A0A427AWG6_ENSVE|nr:hypothetical protein B296_00015703 [Ensete ventricosum]